MSSAAWNGKTSKISDRAWEAAAGPRIAVAGARIAGASGRIAVAGAGIAGRAMQMRGCLACAVKAVPHSIAAPFAPASPHEAHKLQAPPAPGGHPHSLASSSKVQRAAASSALNAHTL